MTKSSIFIATLAIGLLSACATYTPPADNNIDKTKTVNASFAKTWQNATEWFANNNVPIKNIVKDSGLIATDYQLGTDSSYLDCGTVGTYEAFGDKKVNLNVIVKALTSTTTSVRANVFGTGTITRADLYGNSVGAPKAIDCVSTGKLESDLFDALHAK